eukprot:1182360-Prorocentrum_minimum.AAC.2
MMLPAWAPTSARSPSSSLSAASVAAACAACDPPTHSQAAHKLLGGEADFPAGERLNRGFMSAPFKPFAHNWGEN